MSDIYGNNEWKGLLSREDRLPSTPPVRDVQLDFLQEIEIWSYVEVDFVEIAIRLEDDIHVIKTGDLEIFRQNWLTRFRARRTNIFVTTKMMQ